MASKGRYAKPGYTTGASSIAFAAVSLPFASLTSHRDDQDELGLSLGRVRKLDDSETVKFPRKIEPFYLNATDQSSTRPNVTELNESLQSRSIPFGIRLDPPVGQISNPTCDFKSLSQIRDFSTEGNPLNNS